MLDFAAEGSCATSVSPGCATNWSMAKPALDLTKLTPEEKLELIDELWTSISPEEFPLTDEQRAELHRRLDRLDEDGPTGISWDSVRAEMTPQS
jgi:putative addiction module component (TIGR02574 family)